MNLQPMFLPLQERLTLTKEDLDRLKSCGVEVFFVNDPSKMTVNIPITPIILPSDTISKCLLEAVKSSETSRKKFSELMLKELSKCP